MAIIVEILMEMQVHGALHQMVNLTIVIFQLVAQILAQFYFLMIHLVTLEVCYLIYSINTKAVNLLI